MLGEEERSDRRGDQCREHGDRKSVHRGTTVV
jgi:hypothetical protein